MKKIIPILVFGLILGIVTISGCTSSATKEITVKEIDIASLPQGLGGNIAIVDLPDNATSVRIAYTLVGKSDYGMGSNGNMGITYTNVDPNSGESPITKSSTNKYLEATAGQTISGNFTSTDHGAFYYSGNFESGKITIYATVPG